MADHAICEIALLNTRDKNGEVALEVKRACIHCGFLTVAATALAVRPPGQP